MNIKEIIQKLKKNIEKRTKRSKFLKNPLLEKNIEIYEKNRKTVVYIAGAITGEPEYKKIFKERQEFLESCGYVVFNPTILPLGLPYKSYINICKGIIKEVDCVYMIKGWERSYGATQEFLYAKKLKKEIINFKKRN